MYQCQPPATSVPVIGARVVIMWDKYRQTINCCVYTLIYLPLTQYIHFGCDFRRSLSYLVRMLRVLRSPLFAKVNHPDFKYNILPTISSRVWGSVRFFSRFTAEEEKSHRAVEAWASTFRKDMIPFASFEKSFARSSGPGGQNVNKVNSKAEIRFALYSASWILPEVREKMKIFGSRYYNSAGEIVITSEVHRTQAQNLADCQDKLYDLIKESSKYVIHPWFITCGSEESCPRFAISVSFYFIFDMIKNLSYITFSAEFRSKPPKSKKKRYDNY